MASPEQLQGGVEHNAEKVGEAAREQSERLQDRLEKAGEHSPEHQSEKIEEARSEASKEALMSKESGKEQQNSAGESFTPLRRVTTQQKEDEYKDTLKRVRTHLSAPGRTFSKVIHAPVIEKASDIGAKTIARPNAILMGGISAFLFSGIIYLAARTYGYPLSGFETIGAFLLGFIVGCTYDFLKTMVTGKKS
jgi:hypothetical protein